MGDNKVLDGLMGLAVGDALGVPVEFRSRRELKRDPVVGMRSHRAPHNQMAGTWSDDSSLTFCLTESLCKGYDLDDQAKWFVAWLIKNKWTARGRVFDYGMTTYKSLRNILRGKPPGCNPGESSPEEDWNASNGSLMRILPMTFYVKDMGPKKRFELVEASSSITHGDPACRFGCSFYVEVARALLMNKGIEESIRDARTIILSDYDPMRLEGLYKEFEKIIERDLSLIEEDDVPSNGHVQHTLQAALWCLVTSDSYKETVLKAVNLGQDTDTVAAVAGGLAGIRYGIEAIPSHWVEVLARKRDIRDLAKRYNNSLK